MSDLLVSVREAVEAKRRADVEYRAALAAAVGHGCTFQAVADAAGCSKQNVHKLLREARNDRKRRRLEELDARWETFVDQLAARYTPRIEGGWKAEQGYRNAQNAKAALQAAGVTRNGRRSGTCGRKAVVRPTVKREARDYAESVALKFLDDNGALDVVQVVVRELDEAAALRKTLSAVSDSGIFAGV